MRKLIWVSILSLFMLTIQSTSTVQAWDGPIARFTGLGWDSSPQGNHGFGFLGALAIRSRGHIHQEGPLFNYGPYNGGEGYVQMHIPRPYRGIYEPANPYLWGTYPYGQGGYGQGAYPSIYPYGYGQPSQQYPGAYPQQSMPYATPTSSAPTLPLPR